MHIDAAVFRQLQNFLAQELAEGSYYNQLRLQLVQQLNKFRGFYLLRLVNSQALRQRIFLNRCLQQLVATSLRTVRLSYYCQNFMLAAFAQRLQAANCEIRRSHKYYTHLFSSVYLSIFLSFFRIPLRIYLTTSSGFSFCLGEMVLALSMNRIPSRWSSSC